MITIDTSNCEKEPIRFPGAIQPHGVLLVLDPVSGIIEAASESSKRLLNQSAENLLGQTFGQIFGASAQIALTNALQNTLLPFAQLSINSRALVFRPHLNINGQMLVDIEPDSSQSTSNTLLYRCRRGLETLRQLNTLEQITQEAAQLVRDLTGFDRVMIYRFDEDWNGEVTAEACIEGIEPYLGLNFPASDIPKQARDLFQASRIRQIPDVLYTPSALLSIKDSQGIDLGLSSLRSVSPIHIEYLVNMRVRATLVGSLVVNGRLWGLVSCQQMTEPKYFAPMERDALDWFCQDLAALIQETQIRELRDREYRLAEKRRKLVDAVRESSFKSLLQEDTCVDLLDIVDADGFALLIDDTIQTTGRTPSISHIRELLRLRHILGNSSNPFASSYLTHDFSLKKIDNGVAGGLFVSVRENPSITMIWFRQERCKTIRWGGNPEKYRVDENGRLSPRTSFAQFLQNVQDQSLPWLPEEVDSAKELGLLIEIDLVRQEQAFAQTVFNSSPENVAVLNPQGVITMVNASWQQFARENQDPWHVSSTIGMNYRNVCMAAVNQPKGDEALTAWQGIETVLNKTRSYFTLDYPCDSPTERRWFRMHVYPMQAPCEGVVVVHQDFTASKLAELRLAEERTHLRTLLETLPDCVWLKNPEGVYLFCNPAVERFFGLSEAEIVGKTDYELLSLEMADEFRRTDLKALENTGPIIAEDWLAYASNGQQVLLETTKIAMRDMQGKLQGVLGIGHDFTYRHQVETALRRERDQKQALLQNASDGISIMDSDGKLIEVSDSFCQMLGYTREELIGMHVSQWDVGIPASELMTAVRAKFEQPIRSQFETRYRRKDGSSYDVEISCFPIDIDGETILFNSSRDISERKASESLLRKLSLAVDQNPSSIVITDLDANIEYVNQAFFEATGYALDEVIGHNPHLLHSGKTPSTVYQDMWATLTRGDIWKGELINKKKDGTEYIEASVISPVRQANEKITHYVAIKNDISERKMAELRLQESEQRFRTVADAAPVLIWLANSDKLCIWFNKVWLDFTGRSFEQEYGHGWAEGVHPDDFQRCLDGYVSHFERREPFTMEYRLRRYDGEYRWIHDHGVPRLSEHGLFEGYIGSCVDITELLDAKEKLQSSFELFTKLSQSVPGVVYQYQLFEDGHSCFPYASQGIEVIYGVTPEQVKDDASAVFAVLHPDDIDRIVQSIQDSALTLNTWQLEYRVLLPNKGMRWMSGLSRPERLADGSTLWHGFITDITENKALEQQLLEGQLRLKFAFEGSGDGMWDWNVETSEVFFSKRWKEMLGFAEDEISGSLEEWDRRVHPDDKPKVMADLQSYFEGSTPTYLNEHRVLCKDGSYKWILDRGMAMTRDANGRPSRMLGTHSDITDRKQAEIERDRLLRIIEDAPDFIAMSDMQGHLKYLNSAGARMIGLPEDIIVSFLEIKDMHTESATKKVLEVGVPTVLHQGFWQSENTLLHQDGHEIPVSQLLLVHRDNAGTPQLLSTIMRDITSQKLAEQALKQAKDVAEQASRAKSEFLANMSHEIRTPLNAVIGFSQLALNTSLTAQQQDYLSKILGSSQHLLAILNDILDFSKIEANRLSIVPEPFDLDALIHHLDSLFYVRAKEKSLEFTLQIASDVHCHLIGDALRLQQILTNLLSNSIKFTEQGFVRLAIGVVARDKKHITLKFSIEDSGIGMTNAQQQRLFQPFTQADASITRSFGGTGLGLAICRKLAQLMDSDIHLESAQGIGSTFWFEMQFGLAKHSTGTRLNQHNRKPLTTKHLQTIAAGLANIRVLLVEDNPLNQQVAQEFLSYRLS